jgi:hypothetical protein
MRDERKEMIGALRKYFVPVLREKGFTGTHPHYRRIGTKKIDLLTIQFDKWGGGFRIEVAKCPSQDIVGVHGQSVMPSKATVWDFTKNRYFLCKGEWLRYNIQHPDEETFHRLALEALKQFDIAENWFSGKVELHHPKIPIFLRLRWWLYGLLNKKTTG